MGFASSILLSTKRGALRTLSYSMTWDEQIVEMSLFIGRVEVISSGGLFSFSSMWREQYLFCSFISLLYGATDSKSETKWDLKWQRLAVFSICMTLNYSCKGTLTRSDQRMRLIKPRSRNYYGQLKKKNSSLISQHLEFWMARAQPQL